jgi:hypothetical protein
LARIGAVRHGAATIDLRQKKSTKNDHPSGAVLRGNDLICSPLVPLNDGGEKVYTRHLPAAKRIFPTWRARRLL